MQIFIRIAKDSDYSAITEIYAYESVIQHTGQTPGLAQHFLAGFLFGQRCALSGMGGRMLRPGHCSLGLLQESDALACTCLQFWPSCTPRLSG